MKRDQGTLCCERRQGGPAERQELRAQEKIEAIAKETYGAASVEYLPRAQQQIELYTKMGFGKLPICMAKTQYSFSADAAVKARPVQAATTLPLGSTHIQRRGLPSRHMRPCTKADGMLVADLRAATVKCTARSSLGTCCGVCW